MKRVEAILRPERFDAVKSALESVGYTGIMVTEIQGHGKQKGIVQQWRGEKYKVDMLPKVKIEIVVSDRELRRILDTIVAAARTGEIGDGKIFVSEVADAVRIRTDERGEAAL